MLQHWLTFVVSHVHDGRIANPEVRELLMQRLKEHLGLKLVARAAEENTVTRDCLLQSLLEEPNRNWMPIANIMLRVWSGVGYGFEVRAGMDGGTFSFAHWSSY